MLIIRSSIMTEFERNFYTLPKIGAILMATFTVTNTNDSGAGSLRQAITSADASTGKNIINFCGLFDDGLAHTISLTGGGLSITDDTTIQGTNPNLLTISEDSASRVFDITSGATATINGLTITNSYNGAAGGGGISNEGILTLNNSIITGNSAGLFGLGGGIYNDNGDLTVNYSNISGNSAAVGGGIGTSGIATFTTVNHSTITDNTTEDKATRGLGGGIYNGNSNLTVNYSNIIANSAGSFGLGGGIYNDESMTVNYSNISGNSAQGGGGIFNDESMTVNYSNISGNSALTGGGGIVNAGYSGIDSLIVNYCNISGNSSAQRGGGIDNISILTVNYSNITGNTASSQGGGIDNLGSLTVNYGSITDNQAHFGAGIYNDDTLTVGYSTIKHNKAFGIELSSGVYQSGDGGGIYNNSTNGTTTVDYSAIAFNFDTCQENSNNFISPDDIAGNFINNGYNWIGATTSTTAAGDAV